MLQAQFILVSVAGQECWTAGNVSEMEMLERHQMQSCELGMTHDAN